MKQKQQQQQKKYQDKFSFHINQLISKLMCCERLLKEQKNTAQKNNTGKVGWKLSNLLQFQLL